MPITPAIFFGIMSKRVTFRGAVASVLAGSSLAALFVTDQLLGARGAQWFPWLHLKLTLNYTYRGLWGTLVSIAVLFLVSSLTKAPVASEIQGLTVDWKAPIQPFQGLSDWRLSLAGLVLLTIGIYAWLW
jgi:SSS family solute:Na+ symporter